MTLQTERACAPPVSYTHLDVYKRQPLSTTLPATVTPTQVLQRLKTVSRHCYMLESCEDKESSGRYTFLGFDPQAEIH